MRDEDAADASSVTEKCSPERPGQEERDQGVWRYGHFSHIYKDAEELLH